jgi:hypothetical protein
VFPADRRSDAAGCGGNSGPASWGRSLTAAGEAAAVIGTPPILGEPPGNDTVTVVVAGGGAERWIQAE